MSVHSCLQSLMPLLGRCIDDETLGQAFGFVVDCISEIEKNLNILTSFPEGDQSIKQKCRQIVFQIRQVLLSVLQESKDLKAFRLVCLDGLHVVSSEISFLHMNIDDFLKEEGLQKYKDIFEREEIGKAVELLDKEVINMDDLKKEMKLASFKRLKERLRKAENVRKYIDEKMTSDLEKAGAVCNELSESVMKKLNKAMDDLQQVSTELVKSIENGKRRAEIRRVIFKVVSAAAQIVIWQSVFGLGKVALDGAKSLAIGGAKEVPKFIAGCYLNEYASDGIRNADDDLRAIIQLLENVKSKTGQMDKELQQSVLNWQSVLTTFQHLLVALKKSGSILQDEELHDVSAHVKATTKALETLDLQIDKLEDNIKEAVHV
ncbi:uncharacterized protein LOC144437628 [Glandiceps talaboti]